MRNAEPTEVMSTLQQAQKVGAVIRALQHSFVELSGYEIEALLEMSSEYANAVMESLINLSGEEVERA